MKLTPLLASVVAIGLAAACSERPRPAPPPTAVAFEVDDTRVAVGADGARFDFPGRSLTLRTTAVGGTSSTGPSTTERRALGATVRRPTFDEWYSSHPRGVEQGFTVFEREGVGPLVVKMTVDGARVEVTSPRRAVLWRGAQPTHYSDLVAYDATGRPLRAWLEGEGKSLRIVVQDRHATYPVVIDPIIWTRHQQILATAGVTLDDFGNAVHLRGDTLLIAARKRAPGGAVYAFEPVAGMWTQQQVLQPADVQTFDDFGNSVAADGDLAVVGAPHHNGGGIDTGGVWMFTRTAGVWSSGEKMTETTGLSANDLLGFAVAMNGDTAAVGAPDDDSQGPMGGAVYVYTHDGASWSLESKLFAETITGGDEFGDSVAIIGDTLFVGAPRRTVQSLDDAGAVDVFTRSGTTWSFLETLTASAVIANGTFGNSIAVDGDTLVVGHERGLSGAGQVQVHVESGGSWASVQDTIDDPGGAASNFGNRVDVRNDALVVGNYLFNATAGQGFVFTRSGPTWTQAAMLQLTMPQSDDQFGYAVAIDGKRAVLGAPGDFVAGVATGSAALFAVVGETCSMPGECPTGHCVDGYCCDAACMGGCGQCDAPGAEGTCVPLTQGAAGACSPLLCAGDLDCPASCADENDCEAGHYCDGGTCTPRGVLGASCDEDIACASSRCVDGHCCDAACAEQCRACDVAGFEGTCTAVSGAPHGDRSSCPGASCSAALATGASSCTGGDVCTEGGTTQCDPYRCGDDACLESCETDADCLGGFVCLDRACVSEEATCEGSVIREPTGATRDCAPYVCSEAAECLSACTTTAQCVAGHICDAAGACADDAVPFAGTDAGCACRVGSPAPTGGRAWWAVAMLGLVGRRRRL